MARPKNGGGFVLDEQPGAPSVAKQVKAYLRSQKLDAMQVLESLDMDCSGEIDAQTFAQWMEALGVRLPPATVETFVADLKGIEYQELAMALGAHRTAKKEFYEGPCHDCCTPLASCCLSANGTMLYGCVPLGMPTSGFDYFLPLCLHMCLCPQQGCNPCPRSRSRDKLSSAWLSNLAANLCGMCLQNSPSQLSW